MNSENTTLVMISKEDWATFVAAQQDILQQLKELKRKRLAEVPSPYISAISFMEAVNIRRTKFTELRKANKIKVIKKRRKLYVPHSEIERYFNDPGIQ